jgi:cytidine deaminase
MNAIIPPSEAQRLAEEQGISVPQLMTTLLPKAAEFARPPVSNFKVGAISRGLSGTLYLGANVEFAGEALSFTVHAEQSSVGGAFMNGEEGIDLLAVTAAPCGYCRQFLNELATADKLTIQLPNGSFSLGDLLPNAFGPRDLGVQGGLLQRDEHGLTIETDDKLANEALCAANMSYAPYSKSFAGVALRTNDGTVVTGAYAENAAFNPSMSPLEVALSQLNLRGQAFESITDAVLVHVDQLHTNATRAVLSAVTDAPLRLISARNSR